VNAVQNLSASKRNVKLLFVIFWILLVAFVVKTRIKYHSPYLFTWDSVQFALSLEHFDVRLHQPHPPGYLLYSGTLKLWNSFIGDANYAMISLNVLAVLGTCALISLLVLEFCGNLSVGKKYLLAGGAAAIYATTPIAWLYSCVAEIYAVEGFFSALIAYLIVVSWRRPRFLLWASVVMAVAGGFRPTTEFFLFPFYAAGFFRKDRKTILHSILLLIVLNCIWFGTLLVLTGGLSKYLDVLQKQTAVSLADTDITEKTARSLLAVRTVPFRLIQACSLPLLVAILFRSWKIRPGKEFALLLISVPALLFFLFIHYSKEGYLLLAYVPLLVVLVVQFGSLYKNAAIAWIVFLLACFLNYRAYVKPPLYPEQEAAKSSYKWVLNQLTFPNKHVTNARTVRIRDFFAAVDKLNPGQKLFVIHGEYYPDWRTIMYYRPQDEALLISPRSKRANGAHDRQYVTVLPPYTLSPAIRAVIALSKDAPEMKMNSFPVYEYRYFYALKRELPQRFWIYGFEFRR
jgi:Protein O-mannosyl-transferase TMEM260-like